jgi:putative transposase
LIQEIKPSSTLWIKQNVPSLNDFAWQRGYAAFSVGPTDLPALRQYIQDQESHHLKLSFQDEYRKFLNKYGVPFDEQYIWD